MSSSFRKRLYSPKRRNAIIDQVFLRLSHGILLCFAVFAVIAWVTERPILRISSVSIVGAHSVSTTSVAALANHALASTYLYKIDRNNTLLLPRALLVENVLRSDARAKHVDLDVVNLNELHLAVTEYIPALLWCPHNASAHHASSTRGCYHADQEGYIFAPAPEFTGHPFTIFRAHTNDVRQSPVGTFILDPETFAAINVFRTALRGEGVVVREVAEEEHGAFRLMTDASWDVLWQVNRDPHESVLHLMRALPEIETSFKEPTTTPRYIDLRFSHKIFYR
jgi:hypothetical protein